MTPLVLIPGLASDEAVWRPVIEQLADVAACHVAETRLDDTIANIAVRILMVAPPQFALAGISMGGYIALEIMRQAPQRVTKLALFDTSARPDTPEQTAGRRAAIGAAFDSVRLDDIAVAAQQVHMFLVRDQQQRFELPQQFVGAPVLGEFHRSAGQVAGKLLQLALKPREEGERVRGRSCEAGEDLVLIEPPQLLGAGLHYGRAQRYLSVRRHHNRPVAPHTQYGGRPNTSAVSGVVGVGSSGQAHCLRVPGWREGGGKGQAIMPAA